MKKKKYKPSKLSVKISFALLAIIFSLSLIVAILFLIGGPRGWIHYEEKEFRLLGLVFPITFGLIIAFGFSYVLHKTLIDRINKLRKMTDAVAKGDFNHKVVVQGSDELSQLGESFNKMTSELEANAYLSKNFVRNISHEYKTPLAIIKSYSELIQEEVNKNDKESQATILEYTKIIIDEVDRLAVLSKSVIDLSLLDATTIISKEDVFCPAEQIRDILRKTAVNSTPKKIEFKLDLAEDIVTNNKQLLYQIWENLINNAIKFSYEGGLISINLRINEKGIRFCITDQGVGISKEDSHKVFNQFYVGDKARNIKGSGLGLAIVNSIIEKLDGSIAFESQPNVGTTFTVKL